MRYWLRLYNVKIAIGINHVILAVLRPDYIDKFLIAF